MPNILCFLDCSALQAPQRGRRLPRRAGAEYTMFSRLICTSGTAVRPQASPSRRCRIYCVFSTDLTSRTSGSLQESLNRRCRVHCVFLTDLHFTHRNEASPSHQCRIYCVSQLICTSGTAVKPQRSWSRKCRIYNVFLTDLHFRHRSEAAGFSVTQVPNTLCFLD